MYSAENLDRALDAATKSFCAQEVRVYEVQRRIAVSQLFQWYYTDFGANDVEAIRYSCMNLRTVRFVILLEYISYAQKSYKSTT